MLDELVEQRKKSDKRWEENQRKSDEKWEKHGKEHERMMLEISRQYESSIGALGARWGIHSEQSFCNGLKMLL